MSKRRENTGGGTLLLTNARLVYADGTVIEGGLVCEHGRIETVFAGPTPIQRFEGETVDAEGRYVIPGVIDPHVQLYVADDRHSEYASETGSAALGGVTTIIKMHRELDGYRPGEVEKMIASVEKRALIDFSFHVALMTATQIASVADLAAALQITSFKLFMAYKGEEGMRIGVQGVDDGLLLQAFRSIAAIGGVALVHCENQELADQAARLAGQAPNADLRAFEASRPWLVETEAIRRAVFLARSVDCPLYVVHVSARQSIQYLDRLPACPTGGSPVWAETEPHYLTETVGSAAGTLAKVIPPIRHQEDADALWGAVARGTISAIGSDHVAARRELKQVPLWEAQLGFAGIATILPVLLSEGVHKGRLSLARLVSLTSTGPARIFGLRTKGELIPGKDADFVIVDLDQERVVGADMLGSRSDFSIYEGRSLRGWPLITVSRGRRVSENGAITGTQGHGRFIHRTPGGTE